MLVLRKELEQRLDEIIVTHCERQKSNGVPASAAFLVGAGLEEEEEDWVAWLALAPLPEISTYEDPKAANLRVGKKPLKPASECLDAEWITGQGSQLLRSLPGGLVIKGVVLLGERAALRDLQAGMVPALRGLNKAALRLAWGHQELLPSSRSYLVTVEAPRGKPSALLLDTASGATSPARIAFQPQRWASLRSHVRLPRHSAAVPAADFQAMFLAAFTPVAQRLVEATPLFDGQARELDEAMEGKGGKKRKAAETETLHFLVDLLISADDGGELVGEAVETGHVRMSQSGSLEVFAFLPAKAAFAQASAAVKADALRSLYTRLQLHFEEMEVVEEGEDSDSLGDQIHEFPRRVVLNEEAANAIIGLPIPLTDYIFKGDDLADIAENLRSLFDLETELSPEELVTPTEEQVPELSCLQSFPAEPVSDSLLEVGEEGGDDLADIAENLRSLFDLETELSPEELVTPTEEQVPELSCLQSFPAEPSLTPCLR